jgi:hypothetical protein
LLAPQRGLTAIDQNRNQELFIFGSVVVTVIPAEAGIQYFFWIPGRVSLARNDDPTPGTVKLWESPGKAGGLPNGNYFSSVIPFTPLSGDDLSL